MNKEKFIPILFNSDTYLNSAHWNDLFTPEECQKIIDLGESLIPEKATVSSPFGEMVNSNVRDSLVSWIQPYVQHRWIHEKITQAMLSLNERFFKFNLYGFVEPLQFTRYDAPSGCFGMHIDRIENGVPRKLSITVQLTDPDTYEGGDLALHLGGTPLNSMRTRGSLIVFPSFVGHEVLPVTKGTRHSIVGWVAGPSFV
jgi:PKHD-type hydroxylase